MRGSPLLQTILVAIVFALAGAPVWRLTRPAAAAAPLVETSPAPARATSARVEVEAVFAPAPTDFQVTCLDQTILSGHGPLTRFGNTWQTVLTSDGADLVVRARWPGTGSGAEPAAARLVLRFPDGRQVEKSFWASANGTVTEVFTVPGTSVSP